MILPIFSVEVKTEKVKGRVPKLELVEFSLEASISSCSFGP